MKNRRNIIKAIAAIVLCVAFALAIAFCLVKAMIACAEERKAIRDSIDGCSLIELRVGVKDPSAVWGCEGYHIEISEHEARRAGIWPLR